MEAFGEALVVEPYAATVVAARMLGDNPLLSSVAEGSIKLALAHVETEPVTARREGGAYVIEGTKRVVLHAPQADKLVVPARTGTGTSLFLVDAGAQGVAMRAWRTIDELRGADVELRGVRVAASERIGEEGAGGALLQDGLDYATALLCAEAVGAMKFACDTTLEYLKTRQQFGVPIGAFQALQHRMVDMYIELEQSRSMASLACAAMSGDSADRGRTVAAAKLRICDAAERVSKESVQLHGGMGMSEELKVSHTFRRLTMIRQLYGNEDAQLARLGE
jgi:alkylation response protein AidB-like acyl-CoA dehydrogenase